MAKVAKRKRLVTGSREKIHPDVEVKVGILHTIADAIYATPAGRIREAVANSRDNKATWVAIVVDQTNKTLAIFDNGNGISRDRFKLIFKSIGYGLLQYEKENKLSYFGLGLISIFQLGESVKIFTRPSGGKSIHQLTVNTKVIYDPDPANKERSVSSLKDEIELGDVDESLLELTSPPLLNSFIGQMQGQSREEDLVIEQSTEGSPPPRRKAIERTPFTLPESFTEILIEEVKDDYLQTMCELAFQEELCKVLPLKVEKNEPFIKRFTGKKILAVKQIFENKDFCKTIDIYFGIQEIGKPLAQLWKYFPKFRSDLEFPDDNVYVGKSKDNSFAYYIIHTVAEDLYREQESEKEIGFSVRNNNFLVKGADFLAKPGGKQMIDQPLRNWIFGEIFHKNMNNFLTVARNDYLYGNPEFNAFRDQIYEIVSPLNKEMRIVWKKKDKIVKEFLEPFANIADASGALTNAEKKLRTMFDQDLQDQEFWKKALGYLSKTRKPELERQEARIDRILGKTHRPISLGEDEDAVVRVDPGTAGKIETFKIGWDSPNRRIIVAISPSLFEPREVRFLGRTFKIFFVAERTRDFGVSVNVEKGEIYINPFNEQLAQYNLSILDVYLALEIADSISNSQRELKKNVLNLLGISSPTAAKYITPLGDELRRALAFSTP